LYIRVLFRRNSVFKGLRYFHVYGKVAMMIVASGDYVYEVQSSGGEGGDLPCRLAAPSS
jgi:hypothetical protein